jgi:pimeloyl-ACP methyl ester carboxylesterase
MYRLGVLLIHGIGNQSQRFADRAVADIQGRLRVAGIDPRQVVFQTVWWAPVLTDKEESLLARVANGLRWMTLRRFVIHSLADAIAYQKSVTSAEQIDVYTAIHRVIESSMRRLRDVAGRDVPLVVMAHSLGCHMISNYIWDVRHAETPAPSPLEGFDTLGGILMMGCNIPIFLLAHQNLEPIEFPPAGIENAFPARARHDVLAAARWLNFYDPDDVLAYPLRTLNAKFAETVTEDVKVNVGGVLWSWNPKSHTEYWKDREVVDRSAALIRELLVLAS